MEIREVNHSIANRFKDRIEINKHLRKYPHLLNPILKHELAHTSEPWTLKDFKLDFMSDDKVPQWELIKFILHHPSALLQVSPVLYYKDKGFIWDINLALLYLVGFIFIGSALIIGLKYF